MSPLLVFGVIASYFLILIIISHFTSKNRSNSTFFTGNRQSPWFVVAFGMIGASLSGVTFISIPGEVGNSGFSYFQLVLGYLLGYAAIAGILLPLYYKNNLISIYSWLDKRFGKKSYKTGAAFFLISQMIGASFRLFLVANVLQIAFFNAFGIPFEITVLITIALIYVYTFRAGIKTIVWTDTLQTLFMLLAVIVSMFIITKDLNMDFSQMVSDIRESEFSNTFNWDWRAKGNFFKQFFSGAFIAIVMTGLDQNMMQKNLTCRSLKDSQKNMISMSLTLIPVNLLFLSLGSLLYIYIQQNAMVFTPEDGFWFDPAKGAYSHTDALFPILAIKHFSTFAGIVFLLGIIAAAFSSADSALTALTTSFCIDFLDISKQPKEKQKNIRLGIHIMMSTIMFAVIVSFKIINNDSVINEVFRAAGYTYGPLLGLYSFGLFTKRKSMDKAVPFIALASPIISYMISRNSEAWFNGYKFGFELLIINGLITFLGLFLFSSQKKHIRV